MSIQNYLLKKKLKEKQKTNKQTIQKKQQTNKRKKITYLKISKLVLVGALMSDKKMVTLANRAPAVMRIK